MSEAEGTQSKTEGNEMRDENQKIKASAPKTSIAKKIMEDDDEDNDNLSLFALHSNKKKPVSDSKAKTNVKVTKVKKEERYDVKDDMAKVKAKANVKVSKVKKEEKYDSEEEMVDKKLVQKVEKKVTKEVNTKTKVSREKKVYSLPGQKHDPPQERDPLRIFYESLNQQIPTSEMAATWMMEWGLLSESEAEKVYKRKISKNESQKLKSPSITVVSAKKTVKVTVQEVKKTPPTKTTSKTPKKRKAVDFEDDGDDDFVQEAKKTPTAKTSIKTPTAKTSIKTPKKRRAMDSEDDGDDDFVISDAKKKKKEKGSA